MLVLIVKMYRMNFIFKCQALIDFPIGVTNIIKKSKLKYLYQLL